MCGAAGTARPMTLAPGPSFASALAAARAGEAARMEYRCPSGPLTTYSICPFASRSLIYMPPPVTQAYRQAGRGAGGLPARDAILLSLQCLEYLVGECIDYRLDMDLPAHALARRLTERQPQGHPHLA